MKAESQAKANIPTNSTPEPPLSQQQVNELRIIVFKRVYAWLSAVAGIGEFGFPVAENIKFLDLFSAETLRGFVWDHLKEELGVNYEWKDLPRNRYQAANSFLESLSIESFLEWLKRRAVATVSTEERPNPEALISVAKECVRQNKAWNECMPLGSCN